MLRTLLVAAVASVALLLLPGNALATDHVSLNTGDVKLPAAKLLPICRKHHRSTKQHPCRAPGSHAMTPGLANAGWTFQLGVNPSTSGGWVLTLNLARTAGNVVERHVWGFQLAPSSLMVAPDLSSATLDTGTQLGQFGSVKLTFGNAGALAGSDPVAGCTTGTWQKRAGRMTGRVNFVSGNAYFKTIVETSLPASLIANTGDTPTCGSPPVPCAHGSSLSVQTGPGGPFLYGNLRDGAVTLLEFLTQTVGPAQIGHSLSEGKLPPADLTSTPDLSSGTLATTGSTSFTGSVSFTAAAPATPGPYPACGAGATYSAAKGNSTGGIVAHYLAVPAPPAAIGPSFLSTQ